MAEEAEEAEEAEAEVAEAEAAAAQGKAARPEEEEEEEARLGETRGARAGLSVRGREVTALRGRHLPRRSRRRSGANPRAAWARGQESLSRLSGPRSRDAQSSLNREARRSSSSRRLQTTRSWSTPRRPRFGRGSPCGLRQQRGPPRACPPSRSRRGRRLQAPEGRSSAKERRPPAAPAPGGRFVRGGEAPRVQRAAASADRHTNVSCVVPCARETAAV